MDHSKTFKILTKQIDEIEAIDAHTHINSSHMAARGLHDIMLYHMIVSDLYSAGCPSGQRLSDDPDEEKDIASAHLEKVKRMRELHAKWKKECEAQQTSTTDPGKK